LKQPDFYQPDGSFWILASEESARRNCAWLRRQGIELAAADMYIAPLYGKTILDPVLIKRINERRPRHIVVTLGGGTQERLGLYLRDELNCKPSIHCIGAAIAFLSGDQVQIPRWADRMYLGWLFRCLSDPRRYMPRYWDARKLLSLMIRYGSSLPDTRKSSPASVELTAVPSNNDCIPSTPGTSQS
jgi:hypothetical protein